MSKIMKGAVYAPPLGNDLPEVAIIISEGEVITAEAVPSVEAGEKLLAKLLAGLAAKAKEHK